MPIKAFFGEYSGSAIAKNKDSLYFGVTVRDLDVKIGPSGNGFSLKWTTVTRKGGTPNKPKVKRKSTSMIFSPAEKRGLYRAASSGDPLSGKNMIWARLSKQTLTVYALGLTPSGAYELTSYERRLVAGGLRLKFTRLRDGDPVRIVTGKLTRDR
ncbi:MAG: hypothetical protein ABFS30_10970 [Pseudomonadota bacterium]